MVKDIQLILDSMDYSPRSIVQGQLIVSVDKPKKYHSIVVKLRGKAKVHWTESQGKRTVHYRNSETYVRVHTTVWELENSPTGDLPIGEHHFPFSFQLPQNAPPSFKGDFGRVRYKVKGKIIQSGVINTIIKSKHAVKVCLNVKDGASPILPLYSEPKTVERSKRLKFFCFNSGSVSASVFVPRAGFSPGEMIPISVHVDNQSSRQICVASALQRKDTFTASQGKQRVVTNPAARTTSSPIMPGVSTSYNDENLYIPTEAPTTMRNCSCIRVEYELAIKVLIPWSFNMVLKIPMLIANSESTAVLGPAVLVNSQPQPPYNPVGSQIASKELGTKALT